MDTLYPNLHERFKTEGLCTICLLEMELTPRYSCANGHTMCHRCRPYYYGCPACQSPLDVETPPSQMNAPPPMSFMAHPVPPYPVPPYPPSSCPMPPYPMPRHRASRWDDHSPSAPSPSADLLSCERSAYEPPSEDQQLYPCSYSHLGCWVKVPVHLQTLHESRCQFRPHLEEDHLPTDLQYRHDDLVECPYAAMGCRVRTVPWRRSIHENFCAYKDRFQAMSELSEGLVSTTLSDDDYGGDPEELVQCKFKRYGCMVRMPRRRKSMHEQKCNYRDCHGETEEDEFEHIHEPELDPEEQVDCRWSENGCRVRPKRHRKQIHEDKCNYRMEECAFKEYGCYAMFIPAKRYAHERNCEFAN